MTPATAFRWDAEAQVMRPTHPGLAASRFDADATYLLTAVEHRSGKSHDHEFAWLGEAFKNLPEGLAEQIPTVEHLRKRALIATGFYAETMIDAGSNAAALRVAAFMRAKDEFAHVVVRGAYAVERVAKSQSRRAMDKAEFQASKTAILDYVANLIGVAPETLDRQREAA